MPLLCKLPGEALPQQKATERIFEKAQGPAYTKWKYCRQAGKNIAITFKNPDETETHPGLFFYSDTKSDAAFALTRHFPRRKTTKEIKAPQVHVISREVDSAKGLPLG